jgi:DNA-binding response OmpR family regulator
MLTAHDDIGDLVRGLDAGADDYLVKPFSLLELAARLPALARRDVRGDLPGSRELRLGVGPRVVQGLQEPAS